MKMKVSFLFFCSLIGQSCTSKIEVHQFNKNKNSDSGVLTQLTIQSCNVVNESENSSFECSLETPTSVNDFSLMASICNSNLISNCENYPSEITSNFSVIGSIYSINLSNYEDLNLFPGESVKLSLSFKDNETLEIIDSNQTQTINHPSTIKEIYRSVGCGNSNALLTGTSPQTNSLYIKDGIASFDENIINSVGLGDAIEYDSNNDGNIDSIAFIYRRMDENQFYIRDKNGLVPNNSVLSNTNWTIFRAYSDISQAEDGNENSSIDVAVRDFDTWTGGKDLVASDESWNLILYADNICTENITISGWTTNAQGNSLSIFTPYLPKHVGSPQRHLGHSASGGATIIPTNTGHAFTIDDSNITVEGVAVSDVKGSSPEAFRVNGDNFNLGYSLIYNLPVSQSDAIYTLTDNITLNIYNTIFHDIARSAIHVQYAGGVTINATNITAYNLKLNNTENKWTGIGEDITLTNQNNVFNIKNSFVHAFQDKAFQIFSAGTSNWGNSTNNASMDNTAPGTFSIFSATPVFQGVDNYLLSNTDTTIKDMGESDIPFKLDIIGNPRVNNTTIDIGASETY